jgi:ubiquinone/menaquinone biosynthesis C-methylase UbiE
MGPGKDQAEVAQHKQRVTRVFNIASADYDNTALRFFPFTADRMVDYLRPRRGWKVLDVATGTGALCLALARAVGPEGRVMGIDLSEGMLNRAEETMKKMSIQNVDLFQMDAEQPDFSNNFFHAVTCSFGLFFIPDMVTALAQWRRVTRPNGVVLFSSFTEKAFAQLGECFVEDLAAAGIDMADKPMASSRLKNADICKLLMEEAGYSNIQQTTMQMGYHLADENAWWDVVWGSAMRGLIELLPEAERDDFKAKHLMRIAELRTKDGLWMDVEVRLTLGQVPE